MAPLGLLIAMGLGSGRLLRTGVLMAKKWLVVPVSARAFWMGGPTEEARGETKLQAMGEWLTQLWDNDSSGGFPRHQVLEGRVRRVMMVVLPPMVLSTVAASW